MSVSVNSAAFVSVRHLCDSVTWRRIRRSATRDRRVRRRLTRFIRRLTRAFATRSRRRRFARARDSSLAFPPCVVLIHPLASIDMASKRVANEIATRVRVADASRARAARVVERMCDTDSSDARERGKVRHLDCDRACVCANRMHARTRSTSESAFVRRRRRARAVDRDSI